jgi:hypothetical protein
MKTLSQINAIDQLFLNAKYAHKLGKITGLLATTQLDMLDVQEATKPHIEKMKAVQAELLKKYGGKIVEVPKEGTDLVYLQTHFIDADEKDEAKISEAMGRAEAYSLEFSMLLNSEREITLPTFTREHFKGASGDFFMDFFQDLKNLGLLQ